MCERERERVSVCVCECVSVRERECVCVCVSGDAGLDCDVADYLPAIVFFITLKPRVE